MKKKSDKKRKRIINLFVTPELLKKWINNDTFNQNEIILDPSQLDGVDDLTFDVVFNASVCERIIKGIYEKECKDYLTRWELVNCTPEDKIRLIHLIDQKFITARSEP
jgi:hypothetical protein